MKSLFAKKGAASCCLALLLTIAIGAPAAAFAANPDPDRYIVSFLDVGKGKAALRAAGARIVLDLPRHEVAAVHIPSRALKGLRRNPNIEYIENDVLRFPMAETTPWGIPAVQADLVNDLMSANRIVCIIDSGYDNGHEDLRLLNADNATADSGSGDPFEDLCHHGTHVVGSISAIFNGIGVVGVLPSGTIGLHIVKVFGGTDCAWTYSSSLVAALGACQDAGAHVVSMSLGGGFKSRTEDRAFKAAQQDGILSIAASGNDGNTRKSYPASYNSVVSVAAVDSALVVADFSQQNSQVELAGPGVAVRSTVTMGGGLEESLVVGGSGVEATGMEGSSQGTGSGVLFRCNTVDGLGSPGDCYGASGRVCLIKRGDITFADKVLECQNQGGTAAVIYNNVPALFSGTLGGVSTAIPSVGISGVDGDDLIVLPSGTTADVTVAPGNYAFFDGTSMATPHVSGVAALVWSQDTNCTNDEVRTALTSSAKDLGVAGRDPAYGFGLVQAAAAVAALSCGSGPVDPPPGSCPLLPTGASCVSDAECCSNKCKGKPLNKACK